MARKTKRDWLMAAMEILVAQGVDGITIEALTKRMELTKGSFYHHFKDIAEFRTEMLVLCLQESTTNIIVQVDEVATPSERLTRLLEFTSQTNPLEAAFRAWALRDPQAQATLTQMDTQRMAYLVALMHDNGLDETRAMQAARLLYTTYIGGHQITPALSTRQLLELFGVIRGYYNV
jgi:AcrR family transcriptional regulator